MTNLAALKSLIHYPVTDDACELALLNRGIAITGITVTDTYTTANKQAVELAYADILCTLISAPNVSEGGYSISLSDKQAIIKEANGIYSKYGIPSPLSPTATFVQRW